MEELKTLHSKLCVESLEEPAHHPRRSKVKSHTANESTKVQNARLCATKKQHTFLSTVELKLYSTE